MHGLCDMCVCKLDGYYIIIVFSSSHFVIIIIIMCWVLLFYRDLANRRRSHAVPLTTGGRGLKRTRFELIVLIFIIWCLIPFIPHSPSLLFPLPLSLGSLRARYCLLYHSRRNRVISPLTGPSPGVSHNPLSS